MKLAITGFSLTVGENKFSLQSKIDEIVNMKWRFYYD